MKLTDEQREMLVDLYTDYDGDIKASICAVFDKGLEMIAASDTHRIVEAPEGFKFDGPQYESLHVPKHDIYMGYFHTRPIPTPCPPPKLEPATVTVESVYGETPLIPDGCKEQQAVFGQVGQLRDQGFSQLLGVEGTVLRSGTFNPELYRICLRPWPPK